MGLITNPFQEMIDQFRDIVKEEVGKLYLSPNIAEAPEYLSIEETASFLRLEESYVYHLKAKIPYYKPGNKVYFKKSDLVTYMESHRREPGSLNQKLNYEKLPHIRPQRIRFVRLSNKESK